jgi:uncharacterized protein (TIGR03435 family)
MPTLLLACFLLPTAFAQFEVASVKPSGPATTCNIRRLPGGRFSASQCTVMNLVNYAFEMPQQQVTGAPAWLTSERFDISALPKPGANPEPGSNLHETEDMLKVLLEDRFSLKVHHTEQERPIYALVVAKGGPKLEANSGNEFGILRQGRRIRFQKVTMAMVARALSAQFHSDELERPVIDRTDLTGEFDFTLDWAPGFTSAGRAFKSSQDLGGPSVFTAIQQLGLRLQAEKGPVDTLVIEHVERPSGN